jgi:hypothetical protein
MKKQIIFLKIGILILLSPFELKNKQYQGKFARIFLKIGILILLLPFELKNKQY